MVVGEGEDTDRIFRDLPHYLREGDVLVLNETRVIAARVFGVRPTGGRVEVLLLRPSHAGRYDPNASSWHALVRPGRRLGVGQPISFGELGTARVSALLEEGIREVQFDLNVPFEQFLERAGRLPLPPYIKNESEEAQVRYQTVFAREPGSVAAPTASLHFTQSVLDEIEKKGVRIVKLVLDVGLGTFRPMKAERLDEHVMHAESYRLPRETIREIEAARREGRRVIAAGTTVMRALEGNAARHGRLREGDDETDIFITPGFEFRVVDAMITNFHLPHSTLLVLICAFAGRERVFRAYRHAVERRYRFFSFGDAMFLTRETCA